MNEIKEKGWIRTMLNTDKKESKQLTGTGKGLLLIIYNMFLGISNKGTTFGRMSVLGRHLEWPRHVSDNALRNIWKEVFLQRKRQDQIKVRQFLTPTKKEIDIYCFEHVLKITKRI